jgi:hypothetical protein
MSRALTRALTLREFGVRGGRVFIHELTRNFAKKPHECLCPFVLFRVASWIKSSARVWPTLTLLKAQAPEALVQV